MTDKYQELWKMMDAYWRVCDCLQALTDAMNDFQDRAERAITNEVRRVTDGVLPVSK
jgi:hypothetical protein